MFDLVIGNPPYNKGLLKGIPNRASGYPHIHFVNLMLGRACRVVFVIPAGFMTLPSLDQFRRDMIQRKCVESIVTYNNERQQIFRVGVNQLAVLTVSNQACKRTRYQNSFDVDLSAYTYQDQQTTRTTWPLFETENDREQYEKHTRNTSTIKRSNTLVANSIGFGLRGPVEPVLNGIPTNRKGEPIKCPAYIYFDTEQEAVAYYEFMKTDRFQQLYKMTHSVLKNQPQFIAQLGTNT